MWLTMFYYIPRIVNFWLPFFAKKPCLIAFNRVCENLSLPCTTPPPSPSGYVMDRSIFTVFLQSNVCSWLDNDAFEMEEKIRLQNNHGMTATPLTCK